MSTVSDIDELDATSADLHAKAITHQDPNRKGPRKWEYLKPGCSHRPARAPRELTLTDPRGKLLVVNLRTSEFIQSKNRELLHFVSTFSEDVFDLVLNRKHNNNFTIKCAARDEAKRKSVTERIRAHYLVKSVCAISRLERED